MYAVRRRYLWITIVYNITYSVALFALLMFYLGTHDMLAPFNPLLKFILVKSVVFFTFWQVCADAARRGAVTRPRAVVLRYGTCCAYVDKYFTVRAGYPAGNPGWHGRDCERGGCRQRAEPAHLPGDAACVDRDVLRVPSQRVPRGRCAGPPCQNKHSQYRTT